MHPGVLLPAAARLGDKSQVAADAHGCPACPHPGIGPIVTGSPDVFVNGRPAARKDDLGIHAVCCGPNNFTIKGGSPTVYVNGKPFARMNDQTQHCGGSGPIVEGSPDVNVDDGASGQGLGSYSMQALSIAVQQGQAAKAGKPKKGSDSHVSAAPVRQQDLASTPAQGSVKSARWSSQRVANGKEVQLRIECTPDLTGSLTVEVWALDDEAQPEKKVQTLSENAARSVKGKWKVEIPAGAAGRNEVAFRFVVKDGQGGEVASDVLFVERSPFRFSV